MTTLWYRLAPALISVVLLGTLSPSNGIRAFTLNGPSWAAPSVPYSLNPANLDLSADAVEASILEGATSWEHQTNASFGFSYAGRSTQTTITNDAVNLVIFRNASNGSTIATTYYWYNSSGLLDADIVFWDAGFTFFSGSSGCSAGFYIEDVAAHEFGHALGLGHTDVGGATMFPSISYCSTGPRSLHADDIGGGRGSVSAKLPAVPAFYSDWFPDRDHVLTSGLASSIRTTGAESPRRSGGPASRRLGSVRFARAMPLYSNSTPLSGPWVTSESDSACVGPRRKLE